MRCVAASHAAEQQDGMAIVSPKNPLLQDIRKAAAGGRATEAGLIVAEGPHLVEEALHSSWRVEQIVATAAAQQRYREQLMAFRGEVIEVSERALAASSAIRADQGILALVRPRVWSWENLRTGRGPVVVLDAVQDPGNAGTIVRCAEAFGASGLVFLEGSVRVSNGKLLRASAGSAFRIPLLENVQISELVQTVRRWGVPLYALTATGVQSIAEADLSLRIVLVLGNEGAGISPELAERSRTLRIPTQGVESLNVGIAASITLFEAARQRSRQ